MLREANEQLKVQIEERRRAEEQLKEKNIKLEATELLLKEAVKKAGYNIEPIVE
jgi:hypothetical protein